MHWTSDGIWRTFKFIYLVVGVINSHFVYDCTLIAVDATSLRGRINQHWSSRFLVLTQVATGVPRTTFKELELTRPSVSSEGIVGKLQKSTSHWAHYGFAADVLVPRWRSPSRHQISGHPTWCSDCLLGRITTPAYLMSVFIRFSSNRGAWNLRHGKMNGELLLQWPILQIVHLLASRGWLWIALKMTTTSRRVKATREDTLASMWCKSQEPEGAPRAAALILGSCK